MKPLKQLWGKPTILTCLLVVLTMAKTSKAQTLTEFDVFGQSQYDEIELFPDDLHGRMFVKGVKLGKNENDSFTTLYTTNGIAAGTKVVVEFTDSLDEAVVNPRLINGKLFFINRKGQSKRLWVSDGTTEGTKLLKEVANNSEQPRLLKVGNKAFFGAKMEGFWMSDGTVSGTVFHAKPGFLVACGRGFHGDVEIGNKALIFMTFVGDPSDRAFAITDGTVNGTKMLGGPGRAVWANVEYARYAVIDNMLWVTNGYHSTALKNYYCDLRDTLPTFQEMDSKYKVAGMPNAHVVKLSNGKYFSFMSGSDGLFDYTDKFFITDGTPDSTKTFDLIADSSGIISKPINLGDDLIVPFFYGFRESFLVAIDTRNYSVRRLFKSKSQNYAPPWSSLGRIGNQAFFYNDKSHSIFASDGSKSGSNTEFSNFEMTQWAVPNDYRNKILQTSWDNTPGAVSFNGDLYMIGKWDSVAMSPTIYKLAPVASSFTAKVFFDANDNGQFDPGERGAEGFTLEVSGGLMTLQTGSNGVHGMDLPAGAYTLSLDNDTALWRLTTDSTSYTIGEPGGDDTLYFGLLPNRIKPEVSLNIASPRGRCDTEEYVHLNLKNSGNVLLDGTLTLEYDTSLTFISSIPEPKTHVKGKLSFKVGEINYQALQRVKAKFLMPDFRSTGDTTRLLASFESTTPGLDIKREENNEFIIRCSCDPNDIQVSPGPGKTFLSENQPLIYTIRFQNTGNDTAYNVRVNQRIDTTLDLASLKVLVTSHDMRYSFDKSGDLNFLFDNIMLPDSNIDEANSHGYIKYTILLRKDYEHKTPVSALVDIYFDQNPYVRTNQVTNVLLLAPCPQKPELLSATWDDNSGIKLKWNIYPDEADSVVILRSEDDTVQFKSVEVVDAKSTFYLDKSADLAKANYYKIYSFNPYEVSPFSQTLKAEFLVNTGHYSNERLSVYPNPVSTVLNISCPNGNGQSLVRVISATSGKTVAIKEFELSQGTQLDLSKFIPGMYLVEFSGYNQRTVEKISIVR